MKCNNCGAEIANGSSFCTACGTPVVTNSNIQQNTTQPNTAQPQFTGQPQNMHNQTPNSQPNPMYGQNQAPYGQPNPAYGQNQAPYGQPNPTYGQNQAPYGQPNPTYKQPAAPRKPLSKKAKVGILTTFIVAVLAVIFFVVILPILTRSKLQGEYNCAEDDLYKRIIFENDTYVIYDDEGEMQEAGTYTINKNNKVTLTDLEGYTEDFMFNEDKNTFTFYSIKYKCVDKKKKLGIKLDENYIDDLQVRLDNAVTTILKDPVVAEEANNYWYYYITEQDLAEPETEFEKALAEELDYDNDKTLKALVEGYYIGFDIDVYDDGMDIEIEVW